MKTKLLITGIAFMALTTLVSAQNQGAVRRGQNANERGVAFVDSDKDGICDNYTTRQSGKQLYLGRGNRNGCGNGAGYASAQKGQRKGRAARQNFVDTNNDGICDNREATSKK